MPMPDRKNEGTQVPDYGQNHLFGLPNGRAGSSHNLLDLDRALNYEIRIVAGNANGALAKEIAQHLKVRITNATINRFSDGETSVSIEENVRGKGASSPHSALR